jgi:signal transduction histidine kinase
MLTSLPAAQDQEINIDHLLRSKQFIEDVMLFLGHDLRNQLSVLALANSSLALEFQNAQTERQQQALKRIKQATFTLQRTAHRYLNIAHIEDTKFQPSPKFIDPFKEIIEPLLLLYEDDLAETGQRYQIDIVPSGILCWADLEFLYSIMENLLENAIKFGNPDGLIRIEVAERGREHEFSVWNSGSGIQINDLDIIFERFAQGTDTKTTYGSGIGLYLAKKMIEAHTGRVWADTRPGEWACITFTLPRRAVG